MAWKSVKKGGKVLWKHAQVLEVSKELKSLLPESCLELLLARQGQAHKGVQICTVTNTLSGPTRDDLVRNKVYLKAFLIHFPYNVPSGYFCADVVLALHKDLEHTLLSSDLQEEPYKFHENYYTHSYTHIATQCTRLSQWQWELVRGSRPAWASCEPSPEQLLHHSVLRLMS